MLLVSDVHGAFHDLARVAQRGEPIVMLGDFVNFVDYRTNEGILADVLGREFVGTAAKFRAKGDYAGSRRVWRERFGAGNEQIRDRIRAAVESQYEELSSALAGAHGYATFGNVDWPALLERSLPAGVTYVDGATFELEGMVIGMVGGGAPTPLGVPGEVSEVELGDKLRALGPVDVLCSHFRGTSSRGDSRADPRCCWSISRSTSLATTTSETFISRKHLDGGWVRRFA